MAVTTKAICGAPLAKSEQTLGEPADTEAATSKAVFTNQYKCLTEIFVQLQAIVTPAATLIISSADMTKRDPLSFLLDLDGEVIVQDRGYWVKIEARRRDPSPQVPHGIDYSLTLHDKYGKRVLGFDNAHAAPKEGGRFSPRRVEYDHWHPDGRT